MCVSPCHLLHNLFYHLLYTVQPFLLPGFDPLFPVPVGLAKHSVRQNTVWQGSRDGAVVRALAFHQCGPGSIPVPLSYVGWVCCWFSSLLRGFFSGYSGFPPSIKTNISKFQFDLDVQCLLMSPWLGRLCDYSPHHSLDVVIKTTTETTKMFFKGKEPDFNRKFVGKVNLEFSKIYITDT